MAELGIQVWQGVLPENDIPALQQRLRGRMVLMGGIGAAIDRDDATPAEIYDYTLRCLRACCPGGHFIPSITYGLPGAVYPHVDEHIDRAVADYNRALHVPRFNLPPLPRRVRTAAVKAAVSAATEAEDDILSRIAHALEKGRQGKLLTLCREALAQGESAQRIVSDGLIRGMNQLGEDFSANRAFVPEMLMAARCMTAALEELKPLMTGGGVRTVGRACIGTVRGDMHDIGKNLVKIMMEGSGVEVIDLGVDVPPERFVETAQQEHCGIIVCSSLLTTTMQEMRRVVTLAQQMGIRDRVKIFVGGAPISQSFCNEIGADIYTEDAASAARAAVSVLQG